jgi:hypothetical protein
MTTLNRWSSVETPRIACTVHARVRMQQRRIPIETLNLLNDYGDETRTRNGWIIYFGKRAKHRMERAGLTPCSNGSSKQLDCYLFESDDGWVVTVGYRHKRIRR